MPMQRYSQDMFFDFFNKINFIFIFIFNKINFTNIIILVITQNIDNYLMLFSLEFYLYIIHNALNICLETNKFIRCETKKNKKRIYIIYIIYILSYIFLFIKQFLMLLLLILYYYIFYYSYYFQLLQKFC